jgi:methylthioribose-1-phosphate isomerase
VTASAGSGENYSVVWDRDRASISYIDQRLLPQAYERREARTVGELVDAIRTLAIRGAPAIGIAGAYGVLLAERETSGAAAFHQAVGCIREARPTAVNLAWAVDRVVASPDRETEATALHEEQIACDRAIARHALPFFRRGARVITHCHTGALATAGEGTALGAIIHAHREGMVSHVYVDETRPLLQGARLTLWELQHAGVPSTLLVDSAAASFMARGKIDLAIVGADRIARNRDTANKIGTYSLAVAARHHSLPFYVAAPLNTFDPNLASGGEIVIEERAAKEVSSIGGVDVAAEGPVANPAFDVTPGTLIAAIVTEDGRR